MATQASTTETTAGDRTKGNTMLVSIIRANPRLSVRADEYEEHWFRIKHSTKVRKIINKYCELQKLVVDLMQFSFKTVTINATSTVSAGQLGMQDNDEIIAMPRHPSHGWLHSIRQHSKSVTIGLGDFQLVQIQTSPLPTQFTTKRQELVTEVTSNAFAWTTDKSAMLTWCLVFGLFHEHALYAPESAEVSESRIALERLTPFLHAHQIHHRSVCYVVPTKSFRLDQNQYAGLSATIGAYFCSLYLHVLKEQSVVDVAGEWSKKCLLTEDLLYLGYAMMFACNMIHDWLRCLDVSVLARVLYNSSVAGRKRSIASIRPIADQLKQMESNAIWKAGQRFYLRGCLLMQRRTPMIPQIHYVRAQYQSLVKKQYDRAKMYYMFAVVDYDLLCRVYALIGLSRNCYKNAEYLIGKRILNAAYVICNGYFLPSFTNGEYGRRKRRFKRKLKTMRCANCQQEAGQTMKCCVGCMAVFYCDRKCQKLHWKKQHKYECNQSWKYLYPSLNECVLTSLHNSTA